MIASPDFVTSIISHPEVWPHLSEDGDDPAEFEPADAIYFRYGDFGFVEFRACGRHWYQAHIAMLRGTPRVQSFARLCMEIMRRDHGALAFTGFIPATNRAALINALRCGFSEEGRMKNVFLKNGQLVDMVVMGAR